MERGDPSNSTQYQQGPPPIIYNQNQAPPPVDNAPPPEPRESHFQQQQNVEMPQPYPPKQQAFHQPAGFQYYANRPKPLPTEAWSSGLFDCMNDPQNAFATACFPCVTAGQISEILDSGSTSWGTSAVLYAFIGIFVGIPTIISATYRTKLRRKYNLIESPAPDWVVHFFCEACALCQEYRELKARGYDPNIGWQGNLARQPQGQYIPMEPPGPQRMM